MHESTALSWMLQSLEVADESGIQAFRKFDGHPQDFAVQVWGLVETPQLLEVCRLFETTDRILVPSANNLGKTIIASSLAAYWVLVIGSRPDDRGGIQGARCLLTGPSFTQVKNNLYSELIDGLNRALNAGWRIPGTWSTAVPKWQVGKSKLHRIEAFTPKVEVQSAVAHGASGAHHRNQLVIAEEAAGVHESVWAAIEGMCTGKGNKIFGFLNPTEAVGPTYERAQQGSWNVKHLSAMDFPNVREREDVVPGAVSHRVVDMRVRVECSPLRSHSDGQELKENEFVYCLPPENPESEEPHPEHPGHAEGEPIVYRASALFTAQVLGLWPTHEQAGRLASVAAWDEATKGWTEPPRRAPDLIAADLATDGGDRIITIPAWFNGANPIELSKMYIEAMGNGDIAAVKRIRDEHRIHVGRIREIKPGDTFEVADGIQRAWPEGVLVVDRGSVGRGIYDRLIRDHGRHVYGVDFGGKPRARMELERDTANLRAQMYMRTGNLINRGLVSMPPEFMRGKRGIKTQFFAHSMEGRVVTDKDRVKKSIGRSPDDSDALVMLLGFGLPDAPRVSVVR